MLMLWLIEIDKIRKVDYSEYRIHFIHNTVIITKATNLNLFTFNDNQLVNYLQPILPGWSYHINKIV